MRHSIALPWMAAALMGAATHAHSLEMGPVTAHAVMGEPLRLEMPLHLSPRERLRADCVTADVQVGERLLSGAEVPVALSPTGASRTWQLQIKTRDPITEPVLEVTISAGCQQRAWQKMTVLASPPGAMSVPQVQHVSEQWETSFKAPAAPPKAWAAVLAPWGLTSAGKAQASPAGLKLDAEPTLWSGMAELPSKFSTQVATLEQAISALRHTQERARAELKDLEQRWERAQADSEWLRGLSAAVLLFVAIAGRLLWRTRPTGLASAPMLAPLPEPSTLERPEDFYFALGQAHAAGGGAVTGLPNGPLPAHTPAHPHPAPATERWFARA